MRRKSPVSLSLSLSLSLILSLSLSHSLAQIDQRGGRVLVTKEAGIAADLRTTLAARRAARECGSV